VSDYNYTLKYEPLSALISQLSLELPKLANQDIIDPVIVTDMVMYCIRNLGIKVFQRKETVLNIEKYRTELPPFFHSINFAALCFDEQVIDIPPQGHLVTSIEIDKNGVLISAPPELKWLFAEQTENPAECRKEDCKPNTNPNITYNCCGNPVEEPKEIDECNKPPIKVFINKCGNKLETWQIIRTKAYRYKGMIPLKLESRYADNLMLCSDCVPVKHGINTFKIIYNAAIFKVKEGKVYFNYMSYPYDEETQEILVPADPIIWQYILYYIKMRLLQNSLINNNNHGYSQIYADVKQDAILYEYKAKSYVNSPSFRQIRESWKSNREIMIKTFYTPFLE